MSNEKSQILEAVGGLEAAQRQDDLKQSEFKVGDVVVPADADCFPSDLLTVVGFSQYEILLTSGWTLTYELDWLRHATPAEIAGHRIDGLKTCANDVSCKPAINIDDDFNPDSRHVSPACHVTNLDVPAKSGRKQCANNISEVTDYKNHLADCVRTSSEYLHGKNMWRALFVVAVVVGVVGWLV